MGMGGKLLKEIHKSRPFESLQQEVFLNVVRTADHLMRGFEDLLKPFTLSATQYNVLRILRGHLVAAQAASGSDAGAGDQTATAVLPLRDGGLYIAGTRTNDDGSTLALLYRTDTSGSRLWSKALGDDDSETANGVAPAIEPATDAPARQSHGF